MCFLMKLDMIRACDSFWLIYGLKKCEFFISNS